MNRGIAILLVLLAGCVPKGRYNEAMVENDALRQKVSSLDEDLAEMTAKYQRLRDEISFVRGQLEEATGKLDRKTLEAGELQEDIAQMEEALAELESRKAQTEASLEAYRDLVSRFQSLIDAGTLRVKVIEGRMVVEMATDILFPPGSATLSREGADSIREVATVLASIEDRDYQVCGHTDDVPISNERFPSNWHLGAARAIAVTQLLIEGGLPDERVSASSYAEFQPADTNRTREGRTANRRIEITIMPDLSDLPGYEELQALGESSQ